MFLYMYVCMTDHLGLDNLSRGLSLESLPLSAAITPSTDGAL